MATSSLTAQKSLLDVLSPGKKARLHRMLYTFGPGNGSLMFLPIDQGIEHGPRDFFPNPASKDPEYQFKLAASAGYSAIACQIGSGSRASERSASGSASSTSRCVGRMLSSSISALTSTAITQSAASDPCGASARRGSARTSPW